MSYALENVSELTDLGDAIRSKTGGSADLSISDMITAVSGIVSGGSVFGKNDTIGWDSLRFTTKWYAYGTVYTYSSTLTNIPIDKQSKTMFAIARGNPDTTNNQTYLALLMPLGDPDTCEAEICIPLSFSISSGYISLLSATKITHSGNPGFRNAHFEVNDAITSFTSISQPEFIYFYKRD